jgi:hypothetical protein
MRAPMPRSRTRFALQLRRGRSPYLARKIDWADRTWLTLPTGLLPHGRLPKIRLIVISGTLLRRHRDLLRRRRGETLTPQTTGTSSDQ